MPPEQPYEIGYKKPPERTRFQKGQSGNPRGRPAGSKNLATILAKALDEMVTVAENGKRRRIPKREAIITQLVNRSAQADLKAAQIVLGMIHDAERRGEDEASHGTPFAAEDEQIIEHLKVRLGGSTGGGGATMSELTRREYDAVLRADFSSFLMRCFAELQGQTTFKPGSHLEVIASRLVAVRRGETRRLIINVPPRHLKSLIGLSRLGSGPRPGGATDVRQLRPGPVRQTRP
jgi:Family of unknown function (DUF5681)